MRVEVHQEGFEEFTPIQASSPQDRQTQVMVMKLLGEVHSIPSATSDLKSREARKNEQGTCSTYRGRLVNYYEKQDRGGLCLQYGLSYREGMDARGAVVWKLGV